MYDAHLAARMLRAFLKIKINNRCGKRGDKLNNDFFGTEKISKILLKMAPPVMLAQLIQALYNVVDSFFVGRYSESGLTALSIIYPIQLLMIALAVGTGVGINTEMAYNLGIGRKRRSDETAGIGTPLAVMILMTIFNMI